MSDNELIDFDPNESEGDWDPVIPVKEQEQPEESGSESSEGSDVEEDEVQIVHDPQTVNEPAPKANPRGKQPKSQSSEVIRRSIMPTLVKIPKIQAKVGEWANFLQRGAEELPGKFFEERSVSTAMRGINAIYMIAYYLSILNTDPSYFHLDMVCEVNHFEGYERTAFSDHDYDEFRMILGVVVAYITAYLMHFNIEICSAMKSNDHSMFFDENCRFRTWARRSDDGPEEWVWQSAAKFKEFNPRFMRFVTPFNFMYVCWDDFAGLVSEVLEAWKCPDPSVFSDLAKGAYRRLKARGEYLQSPAMRSRMYLWKKWKGDPDILYGMARKKVDRDALEKYEGIYGNPYDYLMTSVSKHKMEHTTRVLNIYNACQPLDEFKGEITDVFPGCPRWLFPFPTNEERLDAYRAAEDFMGRAAKRRQTDPDDPEPPEMAPKKQKGGSSSQQKRAKHGSPESQRESLSGGRVVPTVQRDTLDESEGPVQRDVKLWEKIKANLLGLVASATSLAQTAQQLSTIATEMSTHAPIMIEWMDKTIENRVRHSQRMREARRRSKQLESTPQEDASVDGTSASLAVIPGSWESLRDDRDESFPRGPSTLEMGWGLGGNASSSSSGPTNKQTKRGDTVDPYVATSKLRKGPSYRAAGTIRESRIATEEPEYPNRGRKGITQGQGDHHPPEVNKSGGLSAKIRKRDRIPSRSPSPEEAIVKPPKGNKKRNQASMPPPETTAKSSRNTTPVPPTQPPISVPPTLPVPPVVSNPEVNVPTVQTQAVTQGIVTEVTPIQQAPPIVLTPIEPQTVIPQNISLVPPVIPVQPEVIQPQIPVIPVQQVAINPVIPVQPAATTIISPFQGMTMEMQQAMFNHFMTSMQGGITPAVPSVLQTVPPTMQPSPPSDPPVVPQVVAGPVQPNPPAVHPVVQPVATNSVMVGSLQPPSLTIPTSNVQRNQPASFLTRTGQPAQLGGSQNITATGTTATNQQTFAGTSSGVTVGGRSSGLLEDGEDVEDA
jgi:hypothetical protein